MISLTDRDRLLVLALLFRVPVLCLGALARWWPGNASGRENMLRRLHQLCSEGLIERHAAHVPAAPGVEIFYHWAPGMPDPDFGARAWALAGLWAAVEPRRVVFHTATAAAARHYGCAVRSPLKSAGSLAHNIALGQVFARYAVEAPSLAAAWVAEDVIAESRGHGEKVVDACVVDSTGTPALAVEVAGASYASSNGLRLREIHRDCAARVPPLPYEMWTVSHGDTR